MKRVPRQSLVEYEGGEPCGVRTISVTQFIGWDLEMMLDDM